MNLLCALLTILLITACTSRTKNLKDLVRPWSHELSMEEPYSYPFVARYKKNKLQLHFVAASHTNDLKSPTFKTIEKEFSILNPDLIILEPFPYKVGPSPKFFKEHSQRCKESQFKGCSEASYVVSLINDKPIPFYGGEPSDQDILRATLKAGYKSEDVVYFYTLRQLPQLKWQGLLEGDPTKQLSEVSKGMANRLKVEGDFNFKAFSNWYLNRLNKKLNIQEFNADELTPYSDNSALFTQKISHVILMYRDQFIVSLIKKKLNQYERIMVVYGGSHHAVQRLALEELLGPAKYAKTF